MKIHRLLSALSRRKPSSPAPAAPRNDSYLDRAEFRYILWLDRIYEKIRRVPGHVVELGVARGRNAIVFSHLISMNGEDEVRKYFGFDTFQGYTEADIELDPHLRRDQWKDNSRALVEARLAKAGFARLTTIIEGDIVETVPRFLQSHPNFRAALLYVDCNGYRPSIAGMRGFRGFMSPGGVICIDEKQQGGETRALVEFCKDEGLTFQKDASPFGVPAFTVVP